MNIHISKSLIGFAVASIIGTTAIAEPMLLVSHNAVTGPKQEAVLACVHAARDNAEFGNGLVLTSRGAMKAGAAGVRSFVLRGTTWENGARVPIAVSCVTGKAEGTVASVSRVRGGSKIASDTQ